MNPSMDTDESRKSGTRPRPQPAPVGTTGSDKKATARRHRTIRASSMLILAGMVLCLFIIWNRDRTTMRMCLAHLNPVVSYLQEKTDALGVVPLHIPAVESSETFRLTLAYTFDAEDRRYVLNAQEPVIIASSTRIPLFLHSNGRCVIIHERGAQGVRIRSAWLSERDFTRQWDEQIRRIALFREEMMSRPVQLPK